MSTTERALREALTDLCEAMRLNVLTDSELRQVLDLAELAPYEHAKASALLKARSALSQPAAQSERQAVPEPLPGEWQIANVQRAVWEASQGDFDMTDDEARKVWLAAQSAPQEPKT